MSWKTHRRTPATYSGVTDLREFLAEVRAAELQTRASVEFQRRIWDENPVSSTGQGIH